MKQRLFTAFDTKIRQDVLNSFQKYTITIFKVVDIKINIQVHPD